MGDGEGHLAPALALGTLNEAPSTLGLSLDPEVRPPGVREGVWRPDPRDPVDAWLVAAAAVCRSLRQAVEQHYGYHMSAGIAQTKMLAKLASATHKPKQQTVVPRLAVPALLAETPVRALKGMGPAPEPHPRGLPIFLIGDTSAFLRWDLFNLRRCFAADQL